ncbi:hypothetical protein L1D29_18195, partial [Shewanella insulae]
MQHFITEAAFFHFVNEVRKFGVPLEDIKNLRLSSLSIGKPSISRKIYIENIYPVLEILHDFGYQKERELTNASRPYDETDFHNAYFRNTPDMYT